MSVWTMGSASTLVRLFFLAALASEVESAALSSGGYHELTPLDPSQPSAAQPFNADQTAGGGSVAAPDMAPAPLALDAVDPALDAVDPVRRAMAFAKNVVGQEESALSSSLLQVHDAVEDEAAILATVDHDARVQLAEGDPVPSPQETAATLRGVLKEENLNPEDITRLEEKALEDLTARRETIECTRVNAEGGKSAKVAVALALWAGYTGAHRFYYGYIGTALLQMGLFAVLIGCLLYVTSPDTGTSKQYSRMYTGKELTRALRAVVMLWWVVDIFLTLNYILKPQAGHCLLKMNEMFGELST